MDRPDFSLTFAPTGPTLTLDDLWEAWIRVARAGRTGLALELLREQGCKALPELKQPLWGVFFARLNELDDGVVRNPHVAPHRRTADRPQAKKAPPTRYR